MIRLRSPSPSEAAPKSGALGPHHLVIKMLGMDEVRIGVMPAEILAAVLKFRAVPFAAPRLVFEDFLGIGPGHRTAWRRSACGSRP